jgi:hypothetical protein
LGGEGQKAASSGSIAGEPKIERDAMPPPALCMRVSSKKLKFFEMTVSPADAQSAGVPASARPSVPFDDRAGFEPVDGAAVGAAGTAGVRQIKEDPRMAAPGGHARVGAVGRQIGCPEFDDRVIARDCRQIAGMARWIAHVEYR